MSWAMRRRALYILGLFVFFSLLIGVPTIILLHKPSTCFDGIQNQGETSRDHGGPCLLLDGSSITPHAILWARSFVIRPAYYDTVAYIENPNDGAGIEKVGYRFGLYDSENVLVAERTGTTYVMPGGVTPVFEGAISSGNRVVTHTTFQFTDALIWERMQSFTHKLFINNKVVSEISSTPRLSADVTNTSVADLRDIEFVAVIFDPAGNAFASSATALTRLNAGDKQQIVFTWPTSFTTAIGRIDVVARHAPRSGTVPIK